MSKQGSSYVKNHGEKVLIEGLTILRDTPNAIQVKHDTWDEPLWFPLSQVDVIVRRGNGQDSLTVSIWIAKQKGLR